MAQDIIDRYQDLPRSYGKDSIVLLGQQPGIMFAYWEVTSHGVDGAAQESGGVLANEEPVVQLLFEDGSIFQQDQVTEWIGRYYFRGVPQGRTLFARIGFAAQDGKFIPVAQSARVESYRAGPGAPGPVVFARGSKGNGGRRRLVSPEEEGGVAESRVNLEEIREKLPLGYSRMGEKKR